MRNGFARKLRRDLINSRRFGQAFRFGFVAISKPKPFGQRADGLFADELRLGWHTGPVFAVAQFFFRVGNGAFTIFDFLIAR